jgi:ankyrin repeat protein
MRTRPAINLNFNHASVEKLRGFAATLEQRFQDEQNLPITLRVLECLMYIRLNEAFLRYAILHKTTDMHIYKYAGDSEKHVLRAHNDMSFHIISYKDPDQAIKNYNEMIQVIEIKIDMLTATPDYARMFIRKIKDSDAGCMEVRLKDAMLFLTNPEIKTIDDVFLDFDIEQKKSGIDLQAWNTEVASFRHNFVKYFSDKLDNLVYSDGAQLTLEWKVIIPYFVKIYGFQENDFKPVDLFQNALITLKGRWCFLDFSDAETAKKYMQLICMSLPNKLSREVAEKAAVLLHSKTGLYQFRLTQEQALGLSQAMGKDLPFLDKELTAIAAELDAALIESNLHKVRELIALYPYMKNFPLVKGERLIHRALRMNDLDLIKFLVEELQVDINAQIYAVGQATHYLTPINMTCVLKTCDTEIFEYLLAKDADVNIPDNHGRTPLMNAVCLNREDKISLLVVHPQLNPNAVCERDNTALIYAVVTCSDKVVEQILAIPGVEINHKNKVYVSALWAAVVGNSLQKVRLLLSYEHIDYYAVNDCGVKVLHIAEANQYGEIASLLKKKMKKTREEARNHPDFIRYIYNLRKFPTDKLVDDFISDRIKLHFSPDKNKSVTKIEADYIHARRLWTDVVSDHYRKDQIYSETNKIKENVLNKLQAMGVQHPEDTYQKCLDYVRDNSVITVTFKAESMDKSNLTDFQILNAFERDNRGSYAYILKRKNLEASLFRAVDTKLKNEFLANDHARPRYGALRLLDRHSIVKETSRYGTSFVVLKDIVKYNALFIPGDSMGHWTSKGEAYVPCTVHHLEILLAQFPLTTLKGIVGKIQTGSLNGLNQERWTEVSGGYVEVLLPAIGILDKNQIEHIHIDSFDLTVSDETEKLFKRMGISISNTRSTPYVDLGRKFLNAVEHDNVEKVMKMLARYPSLINSTTKEDYSPLHHAVCFGSIKILKYFVSREMDFTENTPEDFSPLQLAVRYNQMTALKLIVYYLKRKTRKSLADLLNESTDLFTAMHIAVKENHEEMLRFLVENDANVNAADEKGWTPLHLACLCGHLNTVTYLIANDANVNAVKGDGCTPLHLAVMNNHAEIALYLLSCNADLLCKTNTGLRAHELLNNRVSDFNNCLIEKRKTVLAAVLQGDLRAVGVLGAENRGWLELPLNDKQFPAVFLAVDTGNLPLLKMLVEEFKVNINAQHDEVTAAHLAFHAKDVSSDMLQYLADHGADFDWIAKEDCTLYLAVTQGDIAKVNALLIAYKNASVEQYHACARSLKKALTLAESKRCFDIARAIAEVHLPIYLHKVRQRPQGHYKTNLPLFNVGLGCSSDEKIEAGDALAEHVKNGDAVVSSLFRNLGRYKTALSGGELGLISRGLGVRF